jgi:hypothetical protein
MSKPQNLLLPIADELEVVNELYPLLAQNQKLKMHKDNETHPNQLHQKDDFHVYIPKEHLVFWTVL